MHKLSELISCDIFYTMYRIIKVSVNVRVRLNGASDIDILATGLYEARNRIREKIMQYDRKL